MISEKDELKIAKQCGLEVYIGNSGETLYRGTKNQLRRFYRLCGVLEEQFENEAEIIRENEYKNDN